MSTQARVYSDVDHSAFYRKEPKRNSNGGFNSFIDMNETTKETPRIQWAECTAKFGLSDPMEGSTRRNLELSVKDDAMLKWIRGFDNSNIEHVAEFSEMYFKKKLTEDVLGQTLYRYSAPDHPEGKYEPLWRVKVIMTGTSKTNFFKVEEEKNVESGEIEKVIVPCDSSVLQPWCRVLPITTLTGLWFVSKGFGATFVATDLLIWEQPKKRQGDFVGLGMRVKKPKTGSVDDTPSVRVEIEPGTTSNGAESGDDEDIV